MRTVHVCWLLVAIFAGCGEQPPAQTGNEPASTPEATFAQQIAAVRAGQETWILVEQTPLADDDLADLHDLAPLAALCIDHPQSRISPAGIKTLASLPKLTHLRIRGPGIDDAALAEIAQLKGLTIVNLPRGEFTDEGLAQLRNLPDLDLLRFGSTHVTDAAMETLAGFPSLKRLHLIDVPITDKGLATLAKIEPLQSLYIDGGAISDAAWDDLFRRRPKLHVHINQEHHDRDPNKHRH